MTVIGLTGSFGTGKTTVAAMFRRFGARIVDADRIAHDVIRKGTLAYRKIIKEFGRAVTGSSGAIDRRKLGEAVFGNKAALARLNRIVHPEVIRQIEMKIKTAPKNAVVVVDAPLLIEADLLYIADKLVVVTCSKKRQIERCSKKFRIKKREVLKRLKSQMSLKRKVKMADFVVKNDQSKAKTRRQVKKVWEEVAWR